MGVPSYVINFDELSEAIRVYLESGISVDISGVTTLSTEQIENLLVEIRDKIQNIDYLQLIDALNALGVKLDTLSGSLGIKGIQKIYGQLLEIPANIDDYTITFIVPKNGKITGITTSQSAWNLQDSWSLQVNGNILFDNVRTKEYGENKFFNVFYKVTLGQQINFIFKNNSGASKVLWVDFNILEDEPEDE